MVGPLWFATGVSDFLSFRYATDYTLGVGQGTVMDTKPGFGGIQKFRHGHKHAVIISPLSLKYNPQWTRSQLTVT